MSGQITITAACAALTHPQLVQIHIEALAIEERIAAQLGLSLRPRGRERTREPAHRRAREVVRLHPSLWADWCRSEALRWQIALTGRRQLGYAVCRYPVADRRDIYAATLPYLLRAAISWSPDRGRFTTHVKAWIGAGVGRARRTEHQHATVARPAWLIEVARTISEGRDHHHGADVLIAAKGFSISSLDAKPAGAATRPVDLLAAPDEAADVDLDQHEQIEVMRQHLARVGDVLPRHTEALRLYYGLDGGEARTLKEVGATMGDISRERARQLANGALAGMRRCAGLDDPGVDRQPQDVQRRIWKLASENRGGLHG